MIKLITMSKSKLTYLILALLVTGVAFGQKRSIKGVVRNTIGNPIMNATIKVKGAASGASSNNNGEFTISAATGDILEATSIGFKNGSDTVGTENFHHDNPAGFRNNFAGCSTCGYAKQWSLQN
jgi:hypothetical protein